MAKRHRWSWLFGHHKFRVIIEEETVAKVTKTFTITIKPGPLTIVTDTLPGGVVGQAYSAQIVETGGVPPDTIILLSGALPDGLTLNNDGTISGSPGVAGAFPFTVEVDDSDRSTD